MRLLALDPGDRVGWARVTIADDGEWSDLAHGISNLKECALEVYNALRQNGAYLGHNWELDGAPKYDLVVLERWALYAHKAKAMIGSEIPSAQFIGMVKLCCWLANVPIVMQGAAKVNSNQPCKLAPAEASMRKLRPELYDLVTQPGAHDEQHDLVAIKHAWQYTFEHYPVRAT